MTEMIRKVVNFIWLHIFIVVSGRQGARYPFLPPGFTAGFTTELNPRVKHIVTKDLCVCGGELDVYKQKVTKYLSAI